MHAQRSQLVQWLERRDGAHAIVVKILDDTNVWVDPSLKKESPTCAEQDDAGDNRCVKKRSKVAPMLGMIQRVSVREKGAQCAETIQLHAPSQILPKARFKAQEDNIRVVSEPVSKYDKDDFENQKLRLK